NKVFSALINPIESNGGDVVFFAGDAFAVYFPDHLLQQALQVTLQMQRDTKEFYAIETQFGSFSLSVRIGVAVGRVLWGVVGDESSGTWFIRGGALDSAADAEQNCGLGEVLLDASLKPFLTPEIDVVAEKDGYFILKEMRGVQIGSMAEIENDAYARYFVPEKVKSITASGEFREVVSVFISLNDLNTYEEIASFMTVVYESVTHFGGFVSGMIFGEKNGYILLVFGAPTAYEDSRERAIRCVDMIRAHHSHHFAAGMSYGIVFAGFVGSNERSAYTVLGDRVNLAARILMKTPPGETWIAAEDRGKLGQTYLFDEVGDFFFKGITNAVTVTKFKGRRPIVAPIAFSTPMIAREKEFQAILATSKKLLRGEFGGVIAIEGEAGSGKSRLAAEAAHAMPDRITPVILQSDALLAQSLNPFISFFSRTFSILSLSDEEKRLAAFKNAWHSFADTLQAGDDDYAQTVIADLHKAKPFLAALVGIDIEHDEQYKDMSAEEHLTKTRLAIRAWFRAWALIEPLLLIFEDSEHMDYDSREVLRIFPRQSQKFPITLLWLSRLNERQEFNEPPFDDDVSYNKCILEGFGNSSSFDFIKNYLQAEPHESLVSFIAEKSNGNPFYIEQLLSYLQAHDLLQEKNGLLMPISADIVLPSEINSLLMAQIDRLTLTLKKSVMAASVQGVEIDVKLLAHIVDDVDISAVMSDGERLGLWREVAENSYTFRYPLLRETAYEMQLKSELRKLHFEMAESVISLYGEQPERYNTLAFHYDRANIRNKAIHYLRLAAKRAEEHSYNLEAIGHYSRLTEIVENREERIAISITLGSLCTLSGEWDRAEDVLKHSLEQEKELKNPLLEARIRRNLGYLWLEKGKYTEADDMLHTAEDIFTKLDEMAGVSEVLGYRGLIHYYRGELDAAIALFREQLEIAEKCGDLKTVAHVNRYLGGVAFYKGELKKALTYYEKNMELVTELKAEKDVGVAYNNLGLVNSHMKNLEQALDYYSKAMAIHEKLGLGQYIVPTANNMGELYTWLGRYEEAVDSFSLQQTMALEMGNRRHVAVSNNGLGNAYKAMGSFEVAEQHYEKSVAIARDMPLKNLLVEFLFERADLYFKMSRFSDAQELTQEASERCVDTGRNDMLFPINLLRAKIAAHFEEPSAERDIRQLLVESEKVEHCAECHFYLGTLFNDSKSVEEAEKLYFELSQTTPYLLYITRARELKMILEQRNLKKN
ncbi:tetratricopeptide repeat protein, partial [bacterium]|nr:tetratricopeptide repeat protein [bacterium]